MFLDVFLKRYFVLVLLGLVAAVAYFQARGTMNLVGAVLMSPLSSSSAATRPRTALQAARSVSPPKSAETILSRNAFDSVTGPLDEKSLELTTTPESAPDLTNPLNAPTCDGIRAAIVTESTDPHWSLAALQGPGEDRPTLRRVGDEVGGKQVVYIGYNPAQSSPSVWLLQGSSLCQSFLFALEQPKPAGSAAKAAETEAPAEPGARRRGAPKIAADIASGIQKISESEFHIDRRVVEKVLEDQTELMKSARIVPENRDGQIVGIRLFGIRPDTLLGTLGLQNGDRLETINGFSMGSPEKALEAYARLRSANGLKVEVNRRGKPMTIDYKIK